MGVLITENSYYLEQNDKWPFDDTLTKCSVSENIALFKKHFLFLSIDKQKLTIREKGLCKVCQVFQPVDSIIFFIKTRKRNESFFWLRRVDVADNVYFPDVKSTWFTLGLR